MGLRNLSIRAWVAITILGATLVVPGLAGAVSIRNWGQQQFALTREPALGMAGTARNPIAAASARGQAGWARGQLGSLGRRTPFDEFRVWGRGGKALMSSRPEEEGVRRASPPLPDPWDIPPEGLVVSGRGQAVCGAVVPLSGVGGTGARAGPDLPIAGWRIEAAVRRGRTHELMSAAVLGIGHALAPGAMLEREIIRPFGKLGRQVEYRRRRLTVRAGVARAGELGKGTLFHLEIPAKEAACLASVS